MTTRRVAPGRTGDAGDVNAPQVLEFRGADYSKAMRFVFDIDRGNINNLRSWQYPIDFVPRTSRLFQPENGPCGLFAVLQAHVILARRHQSTRESLVTAVLDIMEKFRSQAFAFCQLWDHQSEHLIFFGFESREAAASFLRRTSYLQSRIACLLLAISYVFVAGPALLSTIAAPEPAIARDGHTSLEFVLLLITGTMVDSQVGEYRVVGSTMRTGVVRQQDIGFLDGTNQTRSGEALASPTKRIWVLFTGSHFSVVEQEGDREKGWSWDPYLRSEGERAEIRSTNDVAWKAIKRQYVVQPTNSS